MPCPPALQMILEARLMLLLVPGMLRLFRLLAPLEGSYSHCKQSLPRVLPRIVWQVEASQGFPVEGQWKVLEDPWT